MISPGGSYSTWGLPSVFFRSGRNCHLKGMLVSLFKVFLSKTKYKSINTKLPWVAQTK